MSLKRRKKSRLGAKQILALVFIAFISIQAIYHAHIARAMVDQMNETVATSTIESVGIWQNQDGTPCDKIGDSWFCKTPTGKKAKTVIKTVTAYNSVPEQTDSTPCIAAYGDNICALEKKGDHSCAASFPYGTKLNVPGKGVCTVRDVLAPKYADRVDWYEGGADKIVTARQFGIQKLQVSIYEN